MDGTIRSAGTAQDPVDRAAATGGLVAVDDAGGFSLHPSAQVLLVEFEYPAEAACILDRAGRTFALRLDADRRLVLGPAVAPLDGQWLRRAWSAAQHRSVRVHPLKRLLPSTSGALLEAIFETLWLEDATKPLPAPWTVEADGRTEQPATINDVGALLAARRLRGGTLVRDPFGHLYRPVAAGGIHWRHRLLPATGGRICYVEIPQPD
ncbi:hypothetical protein [Arthrobacter sp. 35W]|uniref:hypothetical protein n=1 Tax=Arthrobacter sp. 35W TaxID=1132441 RepID=UPI00042847DE|nr:hypothetical protein [Arthrobacter sp. 35W]